MLFRRIENIKGVMIDKNTDALKSAILKYKNAQNFLVMQYYPAYLYLSTRLAGNFLNKSFLCQITTPADFSTLIT